MFNNSQNLKRFRAIIITIGLVFTVNFALSFTGITSRKAGIPTLPDSPRPKAGIPTLPDSPRPKAGIPTLPDSPRPKAGIPTLPDSPRP